MELKLPDPGEVRHANARAVMRLYNNFIVRMNDLVEDSPTKRAAVNSLLINRDHMVLAAMGDEPKPETQWWGRSQSGRKYTPHAVLTNDIERTVCGRNTQGMHYLGKTPPQGACERCIERLM